MTTWPVPTTRFWTEPSSVVIGAVLFACYSLGINLPVVGSTHEPHTTSHASLWAAVTITAQNMAENFGRPPAVNLTTDKAVQKLCRGEIPLPDGLAERLCLAQAANRISHVMAEHADDRGVPGEACIVEIEPLGKLLPQVSSSSVNSIWLAAAHLHLDALLHAHRLAVDLIRSLTSSQTWSDMLAYCPAYFLRATLFTTAAFLNKVAHSSMVAAGQIDYESTKLSFQMAVFALRRCVVLDVDAAAREANLLDQVCAHCAANEQMRNSPPTCLLYQDSHGDRISV
ncbi:hypothetical protein ASPZODRAFT_25645 [Penicilliopsis zonata CBS 506.65]|uniref:Transcription factor domain-containing protein n=1 Tax=Penicilliopsis zonata CBS 506.65 TaxID=1073090 RepID=A0A1L9SHQ0_9EURO|nr:hypothetical protein ASPZODRAFT_25645 [Penicilliopsis zonata CBS 506.65]OJJ46564.1 hypothetical protein ASPZODRAFT_25645 [Penicilliopsis zonata CBS 506.65]